MPKLGESYLLWKETVVREVKHYPASFKLNTDDFPRGNPGESSVGGVIQDHEGNIIWAF